MEVLRQVDYAFASVMKDLQSPSPNRSKPFRSLFFNYKDGVQEIAHKLSADKVVLDNKERAVLVNAYRQHLLAEVFVQLGGENENESNAEVKPQLLCREFCGIIENCLIPNVPEEDVVTRVRYHTWFAEFLLFDAMLSRAEEEHNLARVFEAYDIATELAYKHLDPCDPYRLEVSFLFALFLLVNEKDYLVALELSAHALEIAIANFVEKNSPSNFLSRVWIGLLMRLTEACLSRVEDETQVVPLTELFVLPLDVLEGLEEIIVSSKLET